MDFTLDSTEKIISISAAGLAVLTFVLRKILLPRYKRMTEHFKKLREMMLKVNHVYAELTPNGGSSIKDDINKIKKEISDVHDLSIANHLKVLILFNTASDALFECNLQGEVVWTNETLQNMYGLSAGEMLGDNGLSCLHPADIDETYKQWQETVKTHRPYRARYRIINAETGKQVWAEATAVLLRDSRNRPLSFWGRIIEISDPRIN